MLHGKRWKHTLNKLQKLEDALRETGGDRDTEETLDTGEKGTQSTVLRDYPVDALMSRFR